MHIVSKYIYMLYFHMLCVKHTLCDHMQRQSGMITNADANNIAVHNVYNHTINCLITAFVNNKIIIRITFK